MFTIGEFTTFLGWCSVINIGLLLLFGAMIIFIRECLMKIHSAVLGIDKALLPAIYIKFLGQYKALTVFLNIVPYVALKIMG